MNTSMNSFKRRDEKKHIEEPSSTYLLIINLKTLRITEGDSSSTPIVDICLFYRPSINEFFLWGSWPLDHRPCGFEELAPFLALGHFTPL